MVDFQYTSWFPSVMWKSIPRLTIGSMKSVLSLCAVL